MKLVLDSGSNVRALEGTTNYAIVPLTICTDAKEYRDDENLDVMGMVSELEKIKSASRSACPGISDYLKAIAGEKEAIIIALSSALSGTYNSAITAAAQYMEENPGSKIYVIDTKQIGPSQRLVAEKAIELEKAGKTIEEIHEALLEYNTHLGIGFCLGSLTNLANNGRINPAVAKIANVINLRITGIFSPEGVLAPTDKCRGDKKNIEALLKNMKEAGYHGGRVIIDHCDGEAFALSIKERILGEFPDAPIILGETTGLCSFYAERTGIVMSYEIN